MLSGIGMSISHIALNRAMPPQRMIAKFIQWREISSIAGVARSPGAISQSAWRSAQLFARVSLRLRRGATSLPLPLPSPSPSPAPLVLAPAPGGHSRAAGPAGSAGLAAQHQPEAAVAGYPAAFLSRSSARPAATFRPAVPSMLTGCSETVLPLPPTNTFALPPTPAAAPAVTPA